MVLTIAQSQELEAGDISLSGAAPIGPGELGRNGKYVFYLPTRFGMYCDDCPGYDEVNNHILAGPPLDALPVKGTPLRPNPVYVNHEYGFSLTLPVSWKSYSIVHRSWCPSDDSMGGNEADFRRCPIVVIRNPKWNVKDLYADIAIMVFTPTEWKHIENADIVVTNVPVAPGELGHNVKYVFALLPLDYYSFAPDLQIVEDILSNDAFRAF